MAGRARTKALQEALEKRAREASDEQPISTLDYVCEWLESGNTLKELALELSQDLEHEVTYARLMAMLRSEHGDSATEAALDLARARASHCYAEESKTIVDEPADTSAEVSRAASRSKSRQWLAQAYNPGRFGQQKGVSVSVSIGSLHLDALRAAPARVATIVTGASQPALPSPAVTDTVDAEVIE